AVSMTSDHSDRIAQLENRILQLETKFADILKLLPNKTPEVTKVPQPVANVEVKDNVYTPYIYDAKFTTIDNQTTLNNNTLQMKVTLASLMENNENGKIYPFGDDEIKMKFPNQILILRFQNDKTSGTIQGVLQLENNKYVINVDPESYNCEGNKVDFSSLELPLTYTLDSDLLV